MRIEAVQAGVYNVIVARETKVSENKIQIAY